MMDCELGYFTRQPGGGRSTGTDGAGLFKTSETKQVLSIIYQAWQSVNNERFLFQAKFLSQTFDNKKFQSTKLQM